MYSTSALFQKSHNEYTDSNIAENVLISSKENEALDLMELGLSYINNGLFSEAALQFSQALNYQTKNINLQFLNDFFPSDSIFRENMIITISFFTKNDSSGASYFFQAYFQSSF